MCGNHVPGLFLSVVLCWHSSAKAVPLLTELMNAGAVLKHQREIRYMAARSPVQHVVLTTEEGMLGHLMKPGSGSKRSLIPLMAPEAFRGMPAVMCSACAPPLALFLWHRALRCW